ncbi:JmjC domain-containing protein [Pontibacillus salipaludis]|uniref:JmjC domain-containing protein n=1 Tax=Pontibacillus salipaludis TaxID=1697394 RepID=A0ABQ1QJ59_9BACI|nr:cupin domain-containing protein [Pontibacillus salipaludis]GGD29569.1 hypothetical protein GCM10011389_41400 [Pontibacillus salipaludis]
MNNIAISNLMEETKNLTKPKVWKYYINRNLKDYSKMFTEVIATVQQQKNTPPLNINVNDAIKPWLKNKINDHNVKDFQHLEDWFKAWLQEDNFCVLIDHLTNYSEDLFNMLTSRVINQLGSELNLSIGADAYAIYGNYGYTPFGIHKDTEPIFLIHCGPSNKDIWYWENPPNEDYTGRTDILYSNSEWKESATHVVLEPGDMVFIPRHAYHLLYTPDFSITLGTALFPDDPRALINTGLSNMQQVQEIDYHDVSISWSNQDLLIGEEFDERINNSFGFSTSNIGSSILNGLIDHNLKLQSNGGFIGAPSTTLLNRSTSINSSCYKLKKNTKIQYKEQDGELVLFLRGRTFKVNYNERILGTVDYINNARKFSLKDISGILEDEKAAYKLLELFHAYRSIELACNCQQHTLND